MAFIFIFPPFIFEKTPNSIGLTVQQKKKKNNNKTKIKVNN
jgi:hypothetical protein